MEDQLLFCDRDEFRSWLASNDANNQGVWLLFYKKPAQTQCIRYAEAVEEAICYGWIDSLMKKLDEERYIRKFTPRRRKSNWSELNKKRAGKLIGKGLMTEAGLRKIAEAKETGMWDKTAYETINDDAVSVLRDELRPHKEAHTNFVKMAPSVQRNYAGWIYSAKREETRKRRLQSAVNLLEQNKKLGEQ